MKFVIISGNPKTSGLCRSITDEIIRGAKESDANVQEISTNDMTYCRVCGDGWGTCLKENKCSFGDDGFTTAQETLRQADAVAIVTPVYWAEVTESLKNFLDRFRRCEQSVFANLIIDSKKLELDDTFDFACNRCGVCCRDRDDIVITPHDAFNITKNLNLPSREFFEKYCEIHQGYNSKLPVVTLRPGDYRKSCRFLSKSGCSIHKLKPSVCKIYPLGRAIDANGDHSKILYFLQDTQCYKGSHSQTIREWLGSFDILREESIFIEYSSWLIDICKTLEEYGVFSNRSSESMKNSVYTALVHVMYLDYDWEKDFLSQFRANTQKLASIFEQAAILTALEQGGDTVVIAPQSESGV